MWKLNLCQDFAGSKQSPTWLEIISGSKSLMTVIRVSHPPPRNSFWKTGYMIRFKVRLRGVLVLITVIVKLMWVLQIVVTVRSTRDDGMKVEGRQY